MATGRGLGKPAICPLAGFLNRKKLKEKEIYHILIQAIKMIKKLSFYPD
jgi:hypothetical protein